MYLYTVISWHWRRIGARTPASTKMLDAQVPHIKQCSMCSWPSPYPWVLRPQIQPVPSVAGWICGCGTCWNEGANCIYTHLYVYMYTCMYRDIHFLMGEEKFYQKICCIAKCSGFGGLVQVRISFFFFLLLTCLVSTLLLVQPQELKRGRGEVSPSWHISQVWLQNLFFNC